ncbi:hypothetical protein ES703_53702 [subsurface metagenome]
MSALLIIALGLGVAGPRSEKIFLAFVVGGVGICFFIRGLLLRKAQRQIQAPDKINTAENKDLASVSTSEASRETNERPGPKE